MIGDTDFNEAVHSDRMGVVMACPERIPFKEKANKAPWQTEVQIAVGWTVYFDYLAGLNCDIFIDEDGAEYRLINYDDLQVAVLPRLEGEAFDLQQTKDGKFWVIPLNGYSLFTRVHHKKQGQFDISPDIVDQRYGTVSYVAVNNRAYENGMSVDHFDLKVGDLCRFSNVPEVMLEDETYCSFDGGTMYRRSQSRNVEMLWRDGELMLPKNRILISQIDDDIVTKAGILLKRAEVKNHRGTVLVSSHGEIKTGQVVKYMKGSGGKIDHEGKECRILVDNHVLYVE